MLELIIALFLSLGIISSGDEITDQIINNNQDQIQTHIIDDDYVVN